MATVSVQEMYDRYYSGDRARKELFDAAAASSTPERVLYPGSFIHVTASFVFPSVTYVDNDRNAKRFFAQMDDVVALVQRHSLYTNEPRLRFHGSSYERPIDEPDEHFDLMFSMYAGFISQPCKRYLTVGGTLVVNDSHGDAGLANLDPDYVLVGAVVGRGAGMRISTSSLSDWFQLKKAQAVTEARLRALGRGLGYRKSAAAYVFRRVR